MCKLLKISRSNYYYHINNKNESNIIDYTTEVTNEFVSSNSTYGTRRIKVSLARKGITLSRRKISFIMRIEGLVSLYTVKQFKVHSNYTNTSNINNELNREFDNHELNKVIVSDLTYVNVQGNWNYICVLIDLYNREIIGYSSGRKKDANLVKSAFLSSTIPLVDVELFHTDRGKEFDNKLIDDVLLAFDIKRSLSKPGCPYDNAVAEATFKTFKTEFCSKLFQSFQQLQLELLQYVNWYNKYRLHSSLGYKSPVEFKEQSVYSNFV